MWIKRLLIEKFRGLKKAQVDLGERQTVLVGPNGAGKSTVLEALALLLGRDRLVRNLTEHDFYGSAPGATDRIRIIATLTGFTSNIAADHGEWFSERRGVPKWLQTQSGKLLPEPQSVTDLLSVQLGFCARFDKSELIVETIRYFHDDDAMVDPFDEDVVQTVPPRLLADIGFLLVPTQRTWDRMVSFNSDLFRKILDSSGSLEAERVLAERDRLRSDEHRVDLEGALKELREGINAQLQQLLPGTPSLELRLTATDADSLLHALVPHYRYANSVSLPAGRHGSGLLSLQTALLVLYIAERRRKAQHNVIIGVEEPELHMPPGVQEQVLHCLRSSSNQLVCTTHSPRVAAACPAIDIRVVNASSTASEPITPILVKALPESTKNGVRKLFHQNRQSFVEALLHRFVLVPEGRTDVEWLGLFASCVATDQELGSSNAQPSFGTLFGIAPTHDACIVETVDRVKDIRTGVLVLVDGDSPGDGYVKSLLAATHPPDLILQWPAGLVMEDIVGWVLGKDADLVKVIQAELPAAPGCVVEIVEWLKKPTKEKGAKGDFLAYEVIAGAILTSPAAKSRARTLLGAFPQSVTTKANSDILKADLSRSTAATSVWRFVLEP